MLIDTYANTDTYADADADTDTDTIEKADTSRSTPLLPIFPITSYISNE